MFSRCLLPKFLLGQPLGKNRIFRIRAAKNDAANRRLAARLLFKGVARQANCFAINVALKRTIRAIHRHADEQYRHLTHENRQLTWLDWLQAEAEKGRADALQALRAARCSSPFPKSLVPVSQARDNSPAPHGAQVTKQGAIIETVAGYAIRRDEAGIYLDDQDRAPDEAVLAMLHHATNMFGTAVRTQGRDSFHPLREPNIRRGRLGIARGVVMHQHKS